MPTERLNVVKIWRLHSGTTIIALKKSPQSRRTYLASDGFATATISEEEKTRNAKLGIRIEPKNRRSRKIITIGDNIYAAPSGCNGWFVPIIKQLYQRVHSGENLTPLQCGEHAALTFKDKKFAVPPELHVEGVDIQKKSCGLTFASFNIDNPTVVFVGRNREGKVTLKEVIDPHFHCHGSGGRFAQELLEKNLDMIRRSNEKRHGIILLKAMRSACKKDPKSGGLIRVVLLTPNGVKTMYEEDESNIKNILLAYKQRRRKRQLVRGWMKGYKKVKRHKFQFESKKCGW